MCFGFFAVLKNERVNAVPRFGGIHKHEFVERGDAVPGTHFTRVLFIVVEIFRREQPVVVPDEPVFPDRLRVELDLHLDVFGDGEQRGTRFVHEHFLRFHQRIDICVVAVALVGERFHVVVFCVARAKTKHTQENAAVALVFNQRLELFVGRRAHVEITVGAENHAVVSAFDEVLLGHCICELYAFAARGGAARREPSERVIDGCFVVAGTAVEHDARCPRIHHDGHAVAAA